MNGTAAHTSLARDARNRAMGHLQPANRHGTAPDPAEECPIDTADPQYRDERLAATYPGGHIDGV